MSGVFLIRVTHFQCLENRQSYYPGLVTLGFHVAPRWGYISLVFRNIRLEDPINFLPLNFPAKIIISIHCQQRS